MSSETDNVTPLPKRRRKDGIAPTDPSHLDTDPVEVDDSPRLMADILRARIITGPALWEIPEPEPLVTGLLFAETTSMIVGPPKQGKTFLSVGLVCSVITGRDWLGLQTHGKGRPVVFLVGEGQRGIVTRIKAWCAYYSEPTETIERSLHMLPGGLSLQDERHRVGIVTALEELQPSLVVIDTLHRHARGAEENSARDMGQFVQALDAIAEATTAHVSTVHHTGKDTGKGARGSSALLGAVDTELTVSGDPSGSASGVVKVTAQRDADTLPPLFVRYEKAGQDKNGAPLSLVAVTTSAPPPVDSHKAAALVNVLAAIEDDNGVSGTDWHAAAVEELGTEGLSKPHFHRMRKALVDGGQVENVTTGKRGMYRVTRTDPLTLDLDE